MSCNRFQHTPVVSPKEKHRLLDDETFLQKFETCEMDPEYFGHEAHLRLAWVLIRKQGEEEAEESVCRLIQQFDNVHGKGTKYNRSLTVAATRAVAGCMASSGAETFEALLKAFPGLIDNLPELIAGRST